jgi:hypothetical protein
MKKLTSSSLLLASLLLAAPAGAEAPAKPAPAQAAPAKPSAKEVTLKGKLGCGKCSFHEAKACQNVFKMTVGDKEESYTLADNDVSRANHEKVCGPASPATITGTISEAHGKKILTATAIKFD